MRTERYRYVEWLDKVSGKTAARELYDQDTDPAENENVASYSAHAKLIAKLGEQRWRGFSRPKP
jgi:hypothetical protein